MLRDARKQLGLQASQTTIIGDTMCTDILGGVLMGYQTILTLYGVCIVKILSIIPTNRISFLIPSPT